MENNFYAGTSNLVLPVKNKSFFPEVFQQGTRLTYYASLFNSIEVNASFYRMPSVKTVQKWTGEVPDEFRFSFKLHQSVTHALPGQFDLGPIPGFMEAVSATSKRGCLLVQLPPKFMWNLAQLSTLFRVLQPYGWRIAIEFRNPIWYRQEVYSLLQNFDVALVWHDMPGSASPLQSTAEHVFIRFHGPEKGYRGSYTQEHLQEYADLIREQLAEGKQAYAYFNNTLGAAVQNLQTLTNLI
ncbi:DUF72 domain-containing protein [Mucilaginibacter segetis]|uniref:DUF72 domain-containing protein n=1 Tax=Mucilaginibacter segetis TaxID=2793071 RepID=A0A934PR54_9SPHI|nr:DUF72 domain-containing protein [Mucilaginibacter segetis]MBK0379248.1 DUF72 domain-containing protein [Mucilaginibacter segetis]